MCGIVGIVYNDIGRQCNEKTIISMRDLQFHRGPDDEGLFIDGNVGLGHRRLSIIDPSGGHQPMTNEEKSLWIVYNGEIYNFMEIRDELIKKGHIFRTNSDTEVILHLYEEKGTSCVEYLNGMFAFAIWDRKNRELFLARDRMGIKPLYYIETKDAFLFSSEIKSFIKSDQLKPECNNKVVLEYFLFGHVSGENTLFKEVKSLLPAHTLLLKDGAIKINEYWSPFPKEPLNGISFDRACEELSFLIQDSVKIRLMSDVPLGTFCSGGIDSSLVTAIAAELVNQPINTFSVGFYEEDYDESSYAKMVSEQYGTNHHVIKLNNKEFAELVPKMIWQNDEPLNFANSVQIYAISKLAKKHVTVVLTGEGSDELFAGYPRYFIPKMAGWFRRIPLLLRKGISNGVKMFGEHRLEKIIRFSAYSPEEALLFNSSFLDKDFIQEILPQYTLDGFSYRRENLMNRQNLSLDSINRLSLLDQQNYLVSILNRQDKMSMAASIESRVPLLDYRIVELANRMPSKYKMKSFQTKLILKKVAERFLPLAIINRRKSGFGVPLGGWFRDPAGMGSLLEDIVAALKPGDLIQKEQFTKMVSEHQAGKKDYSEILWTCINFWLWKKTFSV